METTKKPVKPYPTELRERAVRMVKEHAGDRASEWATIMSIAEKVGCSPETLRLTAGCPFSDRCGFATDICRMKVPPLEEKEAGRWAACWHSHTIDLNTDRD